MEGEAGRDLGRSPNKVTRKAADRGLLPQRALSLKTARSGLESGERSGGQARLGKPFQLLVLLQFPHPAEKQGVEISRSGEVG